MSRFDVLFEGYCDGTLSPAEREEFLTLLEIPEHRARFVELSSFEAIVGDELGVSKERISSSKVRAVRPRRRTSEPSALPLGLAAALGVAALLLVIALGVASGPKAPKAPAPAPAPSEAKATPDPEPVRVPERPTPKEREEREPEPLVVPPPKPHKGDGLLREPEAPKPAPEPPKEPPPKPAPAPTLESAVALARVEAVHGRVRVAGEPAAAGRELRAGEAVETSPDGAAWIRYPDGVAMTVGPDARIVDLKLERGWASFQVPKQPRPWVVAGPHAEATVLGTQFTLSTGPGFTRLDVREGRVRFSRGVSSLVVGAGQYAISTPGQDLALKPGPALWKAPPAGLLGWYKAEGYKGGPWTDHSGLGHHALPRGRLEEVDGLLLFDGQNDCFELPSGLSEFRAGLSAWVVARVEAQPANFRFLDFGAGPACDNLVFGRKDGNLAFWGYANNQTRGKIELPGAWAVDRLAVYGVVAQPGGRAVLYRNGAPLGAGTTSPLAGEARKPCYIGKSNWAGEPTFKGAMAELLLYQRAVSDDERRQIEAYLGSKYLDPTLPAALPRAKK